MHCLILCFEHHSMFTFKILVRCNSLNTQLDRNNVISCSAILIAGHDLRYYNITNFESLVQLKGS